MTYYIFPQPVVFADNKESQPVGGMTLREYYAGLAMQGLAAEGWMDQEAIAEQSFKISDAMLAEAQKETNK